jgi:hypothetical protein
MRLAGLNSMLVAQFPGAEAILSAFIYSNGTFVNSEPYAHAYQDLITDFMA